MDRHQVRLAMLKITCCVLLGTTWVFWSFVFASRPEEVDQDALTSLVRLPASLPAQIPGLGAIPGIQANLPGVFSPSLRVNDPIEMDIVKLPCWDKAEDTEQETSARWIRLTGKACQSLSDADAVTVRNLTNGYVATVFATRAQAQGPDMTTDFIPLQPGKNEIQFRFQRGPGVSVESQVLFMRE